MAGHIFLQNRDKINIKNSVNRHGPCFDFLCGLKFKFLLFWGKPPGPSVLVFPVPRVSRAKKNIVQLKSPPF
jgi:hypothetical protein